MDTAHDNEPRSTVAVALGYALMILAVVAAYLGIRWYGDTLSAQPPIVAAATGGAGSSSDVTLHLLLALIVVIVMARGLGRKIINVRVYYRSDTGQWLPGKQGLALAVDRYRDLADAVLRLGEELQAQGLLPYKGPQKTEGTADHRK